ncbi:hypothetical protein EW146_g3174 [Bondarzewia mesenterica]|uniref:Pheromone receptor n=1 Tax=Bondarzewia mesenterica TaxID=1095465 RepID=A0A4S4LYB8_9AGAM|nr:hypothetical protein EW146_g3174 [Bondarzewia mesenterica]
MSLLSLFFLILILPGQVKSNSIPAISIIAWLSVCNIIHAVNSLIWAGNVSVHVPVWCDIVTKVLLGAMVAVPGAFFCVCRNLELASSRDKTRLKESKQLYMALHIIVQDHRFSIVENFGCQAAVFNSLPALILVWIPPLLLSAVALLYCASASINVAKSCYNSVPLFPSAPEMTLSLFIRRLIFGYTGMIYMTVVYIIVLSSAASSGFNTWTSVSAMHSHFSAIEISSLGSFALVQVELIWWAIPIWSILMSILSAFGEETKEGYFFLINFFSRRFFGRDILPKRTKYADMITTTPTTPIHLLKSGWDDTLKSKTSSSTLAKKHVAFTQNASASTIFEFSSPSSPASPEEEASFTQSTLTYLESNAARQLHLPSPPPAAQAKGLSNHSVPPDDRLLVPPSHVPDTPSPSITPHSSILSADAWPEPPSTIPTPAKVHSATNPASIPPSVHPYALATPPSPTRSRSPSISVISAGCLDSYGYPLLPLALPARQMRDIPFNVSGPSMMPIPNANPVPRRSASSRSSKAPSQYRAPKRKAHKTEAIYMTVVKETV